MSFRAFAITAVCGGLAPACAWAMPLAVPPRPAMVLPVAAAADPLGGP